MMNTMDKIETLVNERSKNRCIEKKKLKYGKIEFNLQTKKHESH